MLKYLKSEINVFISIYMKPSSLPLTWNTRLTNLVLVVQLNNNNNIFSEYLVCMLIFEQIRACVRNLDLRVSIVLKASKSAGAKGDVPKIYGFVHPLHPC